MRFFSALLLAFALSLSPASAHLRLIAYATAPTSDATLATPTAIALNQSIAIAANDVLWVRCYFVSTSALAANGIRYAVTGPASPTAVSFNLTTWSTTTTKLLERYSAANFSFVSTATTSILTERQVNVLELLVRNGANAGTIGFTLNPSTNNQVTVEIGSVCEYTYER